MASAQPAKHRLIIDTDPGNDDILAILLALAAPASQIEVLAITAVEGNTTVRACLRNIVALFSILDKELLWRKSKSLPLGFDAFRAHKPPIVAAGATEALHGKPSASSGDNADYFHGLDGLAGSSETHPEFNPDRSWQTLFDSADSSATESQISRAASNDLPPSASPEKLFQNFTPSRSSAPDLILQLLASGPEDSVTLVSIGPLTNFALAAAKNPTTFLRAKSLISMGGAIDSIGNVTPNAEFNVWADPIAAARVYALSSLLPSSTMPSTPGSYGGKPLPATYPSSLQCQLPITLLSLDITEHHVLTRSVFDSFSVDRAKKGSPLANWMRAFLSPMLDKMANLYTHSVTENGGQIDEDIDIKSSFALHDPMCIYYLLTQHTKGWTSGPARGDKSGGNAGWGDALASVESETHPASDPNTATHRSKATTQTTQNHPPQQPQSQTRPSTRTPQPQSSNPNLTPEDIRIELPTAQWLRGATIIDRRPRRRRNSDGDRPYDRGNWLGKNSGNRVVRMLGSPARPEGGEVDRTVGKEMLGMIFGT